MGRILLLATALLASAPCSAQEHPAAEAFRRYQRALVGRDGSTAAASVTESTLAFYEDCRRAALASPRSELERRDLFFRFMTLSIRARVHPERLGAIDGRALYAHLVRTGDVGEAFARIEVVGVRPRSNDEAEVLIGRGVGSPLRAAREHDGWKVDAAALNEDSAPALEGRLRAYDADPNRALAMMFGGDRAWVPVARREASGVLVDRPGGHAWLRGEAEDVRGALTAQSIEASVHRRIPELRACFEGTPAAGSVLVSMVIGPNGRSQSASVGFSTVASADRCVVDAMRRWRFGAPERGVVGVNYRIEIVPQP
jgi:TonB family protein